MLDHLPPDLLPAYGPWGLLFVLLLGVLAVERALFARASATGPGRREEPPAWATAVVTCVCACAAGLFALFLALCTGPLGPARAAAFGTVYVVEFALSIDNLFVFLLIFKSFAVGHAEARRVLTWGIVGAVILRGLFIVLGASLFARFEWLFYLVGLFLLYSGVRLLWPKAHEAEASATDHWAVRWGGRLLPMARPQASSAHPGAFFVTEDGRLKATPLALVLLAIEASDLVFALDSVPASFAITQETQLVFFANMFAVMGLRCLYALLARAAASLRYLHVALAIILMLIGSKMLTRHVVHLPDAWFLLLVVGLLAVSALASVWAGPAKSSA